MRKFTAAPQLQTNGLSLSNVRSAVICPAAAARANKLSESTLLAHQKVLTMSGDDV